MFETQTIVGAGRARCRYHAAPFVAHLHLQVDADAVVERRVRAVDVQVGQADFDGAADEGARFPVGRDQHAGPGVVRPEPGTNRPREAEEARAGELVLGVDFVLVGIGHGNARRGLRRPRIAFQLLRAHEGVVEKLIRGQMLLLWKELANVELHSGETG